MYQENVDTLIFLKRSLLLLRRGIKEKYTQSDQSKHQHSGLLQEIYSFFGKWQKPYRAVFYRKN